MLSQCIAMIGNMSVLERNNTIENDYFEEFYSDTNFSLPNICLFVMGIITGIFGSIGVIWYERNCRNRFRTVINQLVATEAWFVLLWCLLVYIPNGARFYYGPFGELFCDINIFFKNVLWSLVLLTLNVILMLRYTFIFHVKNFAVINDDVLTLILNLSILMISIWASIVKRFTPGKLPLAYYLCSGLNPNQDLDEDYLTSPKKYNPGLLVFVFSCVVHLVMLPRIFYYRLVTERNGHQIQLGTLNIARQNDVSNQEVIPAGRINVPSSLNNNKDILDIITHVFLLIAILVIGVLVKMSDGVSPKNLNLEENHWILLARQFYMPVLGNIVILILLFTMNTMDRSKIWRKFSSLFRKY